MRAFGTYGIFLAVLAGAVPGWGSFNFPSFSIFCDFSRRWYSPGYRCTCVYGYPIAVSIIGQQGHIWHTSGSEYFPLHYHQSYCLSPSYWRGEYPRGPCFCIRSFHPVPCVPDTVISLCTSESPEGRRIPLPNPLHWIIISENETSFLITRYFLSREISGFETIEKYINTDLREAEKFQELPEVRRLKFHSYITVAEKTRSEFIFSDPLREKGYFLYPPDYTRWVIPGNPECRNPE